MSDADSPWKEAMERDFPAFVAFFFPPAGADIDFALDYEALDTELRKLTADAKVGKRQVDKLLKVHRRGNGDVAYLHVEVQGEREPDFARRVYVYNYRVEDRYNHPVVSLVVLRDDSPDWRPGEYVYELWGCRKTFRFPVVKLLDYVGREAKLEADANPFALLVLADLWARATRGDPYARRDGKVQLIKGLHAHGLGAEEVRQRYRYIDWLLDLPPELEQQVLAEVARFEEEKRMPFVTFAERYGREKGLEEGRKEGLELGRAEGRAEGLAEGRAGGLAEGVLRGIELGLELKFGAEGLRLLPDVRKQADPAALQAFLDAIKTAGSLDDLRRLLP
jgi:hypothetical protein